MCIILSFAPGHTVAISAQLCGLPVFQRRITDRIGSVWLRSVCKPAAQKKRSDFRADCAAWRLLHQETRVQRPGGVDALEDVDHVTRCDAKRIEPGDYVRERRGIGKLRHADPRLFLQ